MIIDAHAHYTSAPPELQAYRGRQIMNLAKPPRPRLQVSDEQLERSMRNQFKRMQDSGIDRLLFSPQASAMGHHFGSELISRYWTEACNDLIARIARLWPDKVSPVCQLPAVAGRQPQELGGRTGALCQRAGVCGLQYQPGCGRRPRALHALAGR